MKRHEHLLVKLIEECAEVQQRASKALRFTLGEVQPGQPFNNSMRLQEEIVDLLVMVNLLVSESIISGVDFNINIKSELEIRCLDRIDQYLKLSAQVGALD